MSQTHNTLGKTLMGRLNALSKISDEEGRITRLFLSPAHAKAQAEVEKLMHRAGLTTRIDAMGTLIGRYEGLTPQAPALLLGSHIDTVVNAGAYDGNLGVLAAISAVEALNSAQKRFPFAIEVLAFGDEENVRFPSRLLSSRAITGDVSIGELDACDKNGQSIKSLLPLLNGNSEKLKSTAYKPENVCAYLEIHIEQGPVLEAENLALGIVTSIQGATRARMKLIGEAGHAGTVPMHLRRDCVTGAAEIALFIESYANSHKELVATVGQFDALPGATNVIAGESRFTLDLRSPNNDLRVKSIADIRAKAEEIAKRRGLEFSFEVFYDSDAVACDLKLQNTIAQAFKQIGAPAFYLPSGAGHDAMAVAKLCPVAMIFTRCFKGISHNPAESISVEDADASVRALIAFIENFESKTH